MIGSKAWNWKIVQGEHEKYWLEPDMVVDYLASRWRGTDKKKILDLGCGLGRHTNFFAKRGFETFGFDLSQDAIEKAKKYAESENLDVNFKIGDMLKLPYKENSFDAILCMNVISHTDTDGMKKIIDELHRVLRKNGECYFTLGSKDAWGFKQNWPIIDENTKLRQEEGPENNIPHFYADYDLIFKLFEEKFKIEKIFQRVDYYTTNNIRSESFHWHCLVKKK